MPRMNAVIMAKLSTFSIRLCWRDVVVLQTMTPER
jgi:hypothetical protein